jgi:murein DD-endopeptidase MepM/ murein hydrolase activator NlpD
MITRGMILVVPRQSRVKVLVVIVAWLLLLPVAGVTYLGWRQSVGGVRVVGPPPKLIGHRTPFTVGLEATRGHVVSAEVRVVQGGKSATVMKVDVPPNRHLDLPVAFEATKAGLREGAATIEVRARDDFWRPLRIDDRPVGSFPATVDLTPPKVEILASTQYVSNGGVGFAAFRVEGATKSEITAGALAFPSFPIGPPERGARAVLIALPWNFAPGTPIAIRARDDAGNVTNRAIPFEFKPRQFPHDRIQIKDSFLEAKVPELLPQRSPSEPLIEGFLVINRDQRKQAEEEKRKIGAKTAETFLFEGPFVQPRNTKVFANFAETRTYFYQGKEIDQQVHFGYDLASTKQSPVPAANKGVVAFTGPLTIYGNVVVLDHGLGLQTLYAHLSSIEVKVGDRVDKGQELGRSGSTGLAMGDHLHYEMLAHGISVTPLEWWDAKWIRDHVNLPLRSAGLPEVAGFDAPPSHDDPATPPRRHARRRR